MTSFKKFEGFNADLAFLKLIFIAMRNSFPTRLYFAFSQLYFLLIPKNALKLTFEWWYWRFKKWKEPALAPDHYLPFFTDYFGLTPSDYQGKKVMDIGCGPRGSLEWAHMAAQRVGLDPLATKYQRLHQQRHQMEYVTASAEQIPFPDGYFDFISAFNALDHVDDLSQSIREMKRVLAPGGKLLLITDIHPAPALCEPSGFDWDIVARFGPALRPLQEHHYEGDGMYRSIRQGVPFDHHDKTPRVGVLTALLEKSQ